MKDFIHNGYFDSTSKYPDASKSRHEQDPIKKGNQTYGGRYPDFPMDEYFIKTNQANLKFLNQLSN